MMHSLLLSLMRLSRILAVNARLPTYFAVIVITSTAEVASSVRVIVPQVPPVPQRTK